MVEMKIVKNFKKKKNYIKFGNDTIHNKVPKFPISDFLG